MEALASMNRPHAVLAAALAAALAAPAATGAQPERNPVGPLYNPSSNPSVVLRARYVKPDRIGTTQNADFPGSVTNDHGLQIGSLFSDLYRDPDDPFLTFWCLSDRGPNQELPQRTFVVPEFNPSIYMVRIQAGADSPAEIKIYEPHPLRTTAGQPVTGLPNRPGVDEEAFDCKGTTKVGYNMDGLDTEGIVRAPDGTFWLAEEYAPSILHVAFDGTVLMRYVPKGAGITGTHYPVSETLPAVFAKRKVNRGLESIAISKDGSKVYAVMQSPLENPDSTTGKASRIYRMIVLETATGNPVAEYAVVAETGASFGGAKQSDMKVSALARVGATTFLLDERTDPIARIYQIDLAHATNLLGTKWDDAATSPSLEAITPDNLAASGVTPVAKSLVVDLNQVVGDSLPQKIEGMAVVDRWTIVVGNDNDYNMKSLDADCTVTHGTVASELIFVRLGAPLPLE